MVTSIIIMLPWPPPFSIFFVKGWGDERLQFAYSSSGDEGRWGWPLPFLVE